MAAFDWSFDELPKPSLSEGGGAIPFARAFSSLLSRRHYPGRYGLRIGPQASLSRTSLLLSLSELSVIRVFDIVPRESCRDATQGRKERNRHDWKSVRIGS